MHKKRIEWIDTAKGICIILVVLNHIMLFQGFPSLYPLAFSFINDFLSSFRMPLYFFLSGVFFKTYDGIVCFFIKKTNKILIPFIFWYIVGVFIIPLIKTGWGEQLVEIISDKYYIFDFFYNDCHSTNGPVWFLLCLFEVNLMFCAIHFLFKDTIFIYSISTIFGLSGLYFSFISLNLPATLDTAMTCLPFFAFGHLLKNETTILYSSILDRHLIFYALLCSIICFILADKVEFYRNSFSYHSFFTLYPCGFLGTLMVIFISKEIGTLPIITYLGKHSIIILCTHLLLYLLLHQYIFIYFQNGLFSITIIFLLIMGIELVIIPILKKYLPYVTAQKDLISLYNNV